jgi:putative flippase GtrA
MLSRNTLITNTPLRYFAVVFCGFSVDFMVYTLIVSRGQSAYFANIIAFFVGTIVNVILIRTFVFPDSRFRPVSDIALTIVTNGMFLGLGMSILWIQINLLNINPYWAKLVANGLTFVLNYATRSIFFRKK